ncbi:response regulator [filamentous cyanobacterium LEGE 11480]|uniref:histidine kinase n=1 Tax=Romeriopsis navalis LEGE 11480 TaxID=2777977 RepID=A0A928VID1_9CYAN|nr:hybrid sensor histidine kinase/response regulator [Romeriopsis navalis]MBE9029151.1 response regulator [Romeriopsis navalis LEGE 11480]
MMQLPVYRVLLIDDDEDDYIVTQDFLEEAEQSIFHLDWLDTYQAGLEEIAQNKYDVYLLDYRLGQQNGLELLQAAIQLGCNKPIILLTGVGDHIIDQQAMELGAGDYLVKGNTLNAPLLERSIRHAIERKQAEVRQSQLVTELATANQELKDFAYIISHDLKAPLRGIFTIATWLKRDYHQHFDESGQEMLDLLSGRVKRMNELIDGVLEYSRVGTLREQRQLIDLNHLVAEVIDSITPPPHIQIQIETALPTIQAEKTRIYQIFQNLISNAIKYMGKPEGTIFIGHQAQAQASHFYVRDTGMGINVRHFERIFQIFQTLKPRDQSDSTGVGLAIVKKIVEIYGGQIRVISDVGQGTTFSFTLPQAMPGATL